MPGYWWAVAVILGTVSVIESNRGIRISNPAWESGSDSAQGAASEEAKMATVEWRCIGRTTGNYYAAQGAIDDQAKVAAVGW